jgi:hypothetical protein
LAHSASAGSDLDLLTHSSSWTWLLDVRRRLNLSIELVDPRLSPLLPTVPERTVSTIRRLDLDHKELHAAVLRCLQSQKQEIVSVDQVKMACTPVLGPRGAAIGVLLVSDQNADYGARDERQLSRIGWWLAGALNAAAPAADEATAGSASADASELHRLASLHRLLNQTSPRTSERELVRIFIDALAVWQDAESWAYLGDLDGLFTRHVALPGSDDARAPLTLDRGSLPVADTVARLDRAARLRLGFTDAPGDAQDLLAARVEGRGISDWLIVTTGSADPTSDTRLDVYLSVLGEALGEVAAVESSRLTWAMVQHLLPSADALEQAAQLAIDELSAVLGGDASFVVMRSDGECALALGASARSLLAGSPGSGRRYEREGEWARLVLPVDVAPPYAAAVGIERTGRALTRRDERLLHSAAFTLSAWLRAVSNRLAGAPERRRVSRSFEQIIEQYVAGAAEQSEDVAVIVLSFGAEPRGSETTLSWIGTTRSLLRPTDLAGRLSSGDIGVLLPDTSHEGAGVVLARLKAVVEAPDGAALWPYASFGMASQAAGSPRRALLVEAQAKAAMGRRRPSSPRR